MMAYTRAAKADDLWIGEMTSLEIRGRRVLLVRLDEGVFAYEDRCAHLGVALSRGRLDGPVLTCVAHEWTYDVRTGRGVNPEGPRLCPFAVKVEAGAILVDILGGAE
jgi:toluene monooxygenase system ferredoxin subunit